MAQYIDKDAIVAEIDDMLKTKEQTSHLNNEAFNSGRWKALKKIKDFLNTLEVKEVDLEKEIEKEWLNCDLCRENTILEYVNMDIKKFRTIAKHFFELGLKAKGK